MTPRAVLRLTFPPATLRPNGRAHWRTRHQAGRAYAEALHAALLEQWGHPSRWPHFTRLHLVITAVYPDRRSIVDDDALASGFKAARDALTPPTAQTLAQTNPPLRLGLVPDDDPAHLTAEYAMLVSPTVKDRQLLVAFYDRTGETA